MINESLLLLIASSVTYLIKFQSQISNVVDRSSELQIRKVFESFDKYGMNADARHKMFKILFLKYFELQQNLTIYEYLLFIFKFNYQKFTQENFPKNKSSESVKLLNLSTECSHLSDYKDIKEWINDLKALKKRKRISMVQDDLFQKATF